MATQILFGRQVLYIRLKMRWRIFLIALSSFKNPFTSLKALLNLIKLNKNVKGKSGITKLIYHDGQYYFGAYVPPWNSVLFKDFVINKLNKFNSTKLKSNRFNSIIFAITKKCPLLCDHCFEWDQLNRKENLDLEKIHQILNELDKFGYNQLILSGGEPMVRLAWIFKILSLFANKVNCWVYTSGYNLSIENAVKLKNEGLKGVFISLDHYNEKIHNKFRGNENSFKWATNGVKNALEAGLLVCLSLCVTQEFTNKEDLNNYMLLAKKLGVSFVQFLEPKPVGHFKGQNVLLNIEQIELLEKFYIEYNTNKTYKEYPLIMYHGYHQRRIGCFNAGYLGLYINTDGIINACPFCQTENNKASSNMEEQLNRIIEKGCVEYSSIEL